MPKIFSVEELKTACTECHKRGVKVYAALNTLVYDSEAEKFAECVKSAAECGVDRAYNPGSRRG